MDRVLEQMHNMVAEIQGNYGSDYIYLDSSRDTRAIITTPKSGVTLEIITDTIFRKTYIGLANKKEVSQENFDRLLEEINELGFAQAPEKIKNKNVRFNYNNMEEDLADILEVILGADYLDDTNTGWKEFNTTKENFFKTIIKVIRTIVEAGITIGLNRDLLDNYTIRKWISLNVRDDKKGFTYFEHLVPIDFIFFTLTNMIKNGAVDSELELYLQNNLIGMYIKPEHANYLDVELGFRTTMPEGQEDNPLARKILLEENYGSIYGC